MLDWLLDGFWSISIVLGSAGVAFGIAWWRTGRKQYAICVGVVAVLFGAYIVLHLLIEKESEQMERRIREIGASVKQRQIRPVLEKNLSEDFRANSYDKRRFIEKAEQLRGQYQVDSLEVWEVRVVEVDRTKRTAKMSFKVKPKVQDQETPSYLVEAEFVMTPSDTWRRRGEWKMKTFRYFNPAVDSNSPLPIP